MSRFIFLLSLYDVLVLLYLYYSRRVAARVIAFPLHFSCTRRAAALSVIVFAFCSAASLEIFVVCYSLLANTTRSAVTRSHRVDSHPRLWELESVAGTSWYLYHGSRCRRYTSIVDAVSDMLFY